MEIPASHTSVLRFLRDPTNVQSLRNIMRALHFRLTGGSIIDLLSFEDIFFHEAEPAERLLKAAAHSQLFTMLLVRFSSARYSDDGTVLQAAADLDRMAIQAVQDPKSRPEKEYLVVLDLYNMIVESKGATYPSAVNVSRNSKDVQADEQLFEASSSTERDQTSLQESIQMDRPESSLSMSQSLEHSETLESYSNKRAELDNIGVESSTEPNSPKPITKKTRHTYKPWAISEVNRLDQILEEHCNTREVRLTGKINYSEVVRRFNDGYEARTIKAGEEMANKRGTYGEVFTFKVDTPACFRTYDSIYNRIRQTRGDLIADTANKARRFKPGLHKINLPVRPIRPASLPAEEQIDKQNNNMVLPERPAGLGAEDQMDPLNHNMDVDEQPLTSLAAGEVGNTAEDWEF